MIPLHPIDPSSLQDEASFEVLFRKCYAPLCRTLFAILKDKALSEDIAQEAFFVLWEKRAEVNISIKSYLYRTAINKAFNHLEKSKRFVRMQEGDWVEWGPGSNTTDEWMAEKELQQAFHHALDSLPPACRTVFLMSRVEEMSYKDIADALRISVKTVENQISKGLRILKDNLLVAILFVFLLNMH